MIDHSDIVKRAGSPEQVALWRGVSVHTVRSWIQRNSIPADHWLAFADAGHAKLEDLAKQSKRRSIPSQDKAA